MKQINASGMDFQALNALLRQDRADTEITGCLGQRFIGARQSRFGRRASASAIETIGRDVHNRHHLWFRQIDKPPAAIYCCHSSVFFEKIGICNCFFPKKTDCAE